MTTTWRRILDAIPSRNREGVQPPAAEAKAKLRGDVLQRMRLLQSNADERPVKSDDVLSDAVLRLALERKDQMPEYRNEDALDAVLSELTAAATLEDHGTPAKATRRREQ